MDSDLKGMALLDRVWRYLRDNHLEEGDLLIEHLGALEFGNDEWLNLSNPKFHTGYTVEDWWNGKEMKG